MQNFLSTRRTIIGVVLTLALFVVVHFYVEARGGWRVVWSASLNDVGQFIGGIAAALAFLWLVLGYLQQGEDLQLQREELKLQREEVQRLADEAARQAKAIEANELHARRDTFLRVADIVITELNSLAEQLGVCITHSSSGSMWQRFGNGDKYAFFSHSLDALLSRAIFTHSGSIIEPADQKLAVNYIENFERLLMQAQPCDPDNVLRATFETSPIGGLYAALCLDLRREVRFHVRARPTDFAGLS